MDEKSPTVAREQSFRFKRRPMAIAAEFRPDWKMGALLLILHLSSRGEKSSLPRLPILKMTQISKWYGLAGTAWTI